MILLRLTSYDEQSAKFARSLEAAAGKPVVLILDGRRSHVKSPGFDSILLTNTMIRRMGLYAPQDFTWRCGDYGYYAALERYSSAEHMWMIEHDVRIRNAKAFFDAFLHNSLDFIGAGIRPAGFDWFWRQYITGADNSAWRCFFPVTRLSTGAIATLLHVRRFHSASWWRRRAWPNDEAFVATTIATTGKSFADFNDFLPDAWREDTFRYGRPENGDDVELTGPGSALLHPLLLGDSFNLTPAISTRADLSKPPKPLVRRVASQFNEMRGWLPQRSA